jgi:hypothetical protein
VLWKKSKSFSARATVALPPASTPKIDATEQPDQLRILEFDTLYAVAGLGHLKGSRFQPLIPNAKPITIPEQDLDPVATTVDEQEQVTGQWVLVKDLLGLAHQAVEAVTHLRRCCAKENPDV